MSEVDYHYLKQERWDSNHSRPDLFPRDSNYVTGATLQEIASFHQFEIPQNKRVMDIGVGYGNTVQSLSELGNDVVAVDVSKVALNLVESYVSECCLSKDIETIAPVDLAICNLVFQHNHEYEIVRIINDVNLQSDGIFTFQFASLNPEKSVLKEVVLNDLNKSILYFYSVERMKYLVSLTNKEFISMNGPLWFDDPWSFEWYSFKVQNKK